MENLEPYKIWLLMAAVAYVAFLFGRNSKGVSPEERQRRQLVEGEEIETALASVPVEKLEEVDRLMAAGKKLGAIKVLRDATGLGLKLSKRAVEKRHAGQ